MNLYLCTSSLETWHPCPCHSPGSLEHGCQPHAYKVGIVISILKYLYTLEIKQFLTLVSLISYESGILENPKVRAICDELFDYLLSFSYMYIMC